MTDDPASRTVSGETRSPTGPSALAPFRSPIFLAMWVASLVSYFGALVQSVGASWLMTTLASSADMVALVQVCTVLPIVLLSLPAGAVADVWDRRLVMLVAQASMLTVSALLAGLAWAGMITPWILLSLTFALGCGGALYGPAWQSSVREQVPPPDLPSAVSLNSAAFNLARAVGPALGGLLVAWKGPESTFLVNAISYLGLIAVLFTWKRPPPSRSLPPEGLMAAMAAGLRFARLSRVIQAVLVRSALFGFLASAVWALMPLVARDLLGGGSAMYGLLLAAFGAGAVAGALAGTGLRARLSGEGLVVAASIAFGAGGLVTAMSSAPAATMLALFVSGGAWVLALSQFNITVQTRTPRWVVGRALAIYQAAAFAGLASGAWLWGLAAERFGLAVSVSVASVLLLGTALVGFMVRMPTSAPASLEPRRDEPSGNAMPIDPGSGPVVASLEYVVAGNDIPAFLHAASRLRRTRRRNGGRRWALLQDAAEPSVWIERFEVPTWLDYLRLVERTTEADADVAREVLAFHKGPHPPTTRFLLAHVPESDGAEYASRETSQRAVDGPSLIEKTSPGAGGAVTVVSLSAASNAQ